MLSKFVTPSVIVDLDIVEKNVVNFTQRLQKCGIAHRPHIKTHKSVQMARKQISAGAVGITTAKLSEAEVFAKAGFNDILLAYPVVGEDKLARLARLHRDVRIITTVDSLEVGKGLGQVGQQVGKPVEVLIELDLGMHRCGVQPDEAVSFATQLRSIEGINVVGVMEYNSIGPREPTIQQMHNALSKEVDVVNRVVERLKADGHNIEIVSSGSTVAGTYAEILHGITEVRSGTYIYHDASTVSLGLADEADCAIKIISTIVSIPLPGYATFDAGSKTLTSDLAPNRVGHGIVVGHPEVTITGLNEEHGYLKFDPAKSPFRIGDRIQIIPNHACVISNLTNTVYGVRGNDVDGPISIDARGCNN